MLLTIRISQKNTSQQTETNVSFEDSSHLFIRIKELDDFSLPTTGSGQIEEQKDQDLKGESERKQGVCNFKHRLIGYYNKLNILYFRPQSFAQFLHLFIFLSQTMQPLYSFIQSSYTDIIKYIYVMQELSPQQYEITLKYMQTTNEENFEHAASFLKQHDFNLEHAVNSKFNPGHVRNPQQRNQRSQQNDQEIIRKYIQFVQRKNAEWSPVTALFGLVKGLLFASLGLLSALIPSIIRVKLVGTDFQKLYWNNLPDLFTTKSIPSLLKLTGNLSSKSVLVLISSRKAHKDIITFMNNPELHKNISRNFYLTGHVIGHKELASVNEIQAPMLVVLRQNIFEELKQVGRTKQLTKVDNNQLNVWANESRNLFKRDGNVLIKYRNFVNRMVGHYYEEEEQEEVNLNQREMERQQINQQNKAYQEMLEQTKKNQEIEAQRKAKEQEERKMRQQIQHERQVRKLSIPDQPNQGDIVRLSFRCPDGSTIIRNFSSDEKLDVVYHWVELNENIAFEDDHNRKFQIMHSYPPVSLTSRREETLKEIFESPQQKVVIKEL